MHVRRTVGKVRFQQISNSKKQKQSKMDLPYRTMKKTNIGQEFSHLDKLGRSILLSTREIPKQKSLPKDIKSRILKIISSDSAEKLCSFLEKQVIRFDTEIGEVGSRWNILHFCARNDAAKCIEYVLKTQYQELHEEYKILLNSKTVEEFTPLVVAIINRSHTALQKMLTCGGVDIHIIDENKMSPYEIALNYRNDRAIKLLMSYQSKTKKKQFVNQKFLNEPVVFPKRTILFREKCASYVLCCISLGFYSPSFQSDEFETEGMMSRNSSLKKSSVKDGPSYLNTITDKLRASDYIADEEESIDYVPIGSRKVLPGYDIEWKRAIDLMECRINLFESYNPFDIQERNFTIKNNLILFQSLTNISWLLRKLIKVDRSKHNFYEIYLFPQKMSEKVSIDDHIPFLKDRKEAMFLSNEKQLWPMLLQKALAKIHNGYFSLINLSPLQIIEQITGFPTYEKDFSLLSPSQIFHLLHQLTAKEFLFCLKGKSGSKLSEDQKADESGVIGECFSVLNFYEKNGENLVLINCPFVSEYWKKKEKNEPLALKLIKGHYNTHNQMCVWMSIQNLKEYFSSLLICNTFNSYERTELKIKAHRNIFIKFKVQKVMDPHSGDKIYMQLNHKEGKTHSLNKLQILRDEGLERILIQEQNDKNISLLSPQLAEIIIHEPGQYFAFLELDEEKEQNNNPVFSLKEMDTNVNNSGKERMKLSEDEIIGESSAVPNYYPTNKSLGNKPLSQYLLLVYSPIQPIKPQVVEEQLGILEWFGFLKNEFKKKNTGSSSKSMEEKDQFYFKTIEDHSIIMLKEKEESDVYLRYRIFSGDIIEGRRVDDSRIQLLEEDNVFYCVLRCKIKEDQVTFDII